MLSDSDETDGDNFINKHENSDHLSIQSCLQRVGISLLSEWDILSFVYRHGTSLASTDQIGRLLSYESAVVVSVLNHLERKKLIERSRHSRGVCLYRMLASTDAERQLCLRRLVSLLESRAGRLMLIKEMKLCSQNSRGKQTRRGLKSEGTLSCLKAI